MAHAQPHLPFVLDVRDPNFARDMLSWAAQTRSDIQVLVAATRQTIATSQALIVEADRILAQQIGRRERRPGERSALCAALRSAAL